MSLAIASTCPGRKKGDGYRERAKTHTMAQPSGHSVISIFISISFTREHTGYNSSDLLLTHQPGSLVTPGPRREGQLEAGLRSSVCLLNPVSLCYWWSRAPWLGCLCVVCPQGFWLLRDGEGLVVLRSQQHCQHGSEQGWRSLQYSCPSSASVACNPGSWCNVQVLGRTQIYCHQFPSSVVRGPRLFESSSFHPCSW